MRMADFSFRRAVLFAMLATSFGLGGCNAARIGIQQRHYQRELARTYDAQMYTNLARVKYGLSPVHMTYSGTKGGGESTINAGGEVGANGGLGEKIIISETDSTTELLDNNNNWKIKADWTGKTTLEYTATIATDPKVHQAYITAAEELGDRLLVQSLDTYLKESRRTPNPNALKLQKFAPELGVNEVLVELDLAGESGLSSGQKPVSEVLRTLVSATLWEAEKPKPGPFDKYNGLYPESLRVACFVLDKDPPDWLDGVDPSEFRVCAVLPDVPISSGVLVPVQLDGKPDESRPALLFLGEYDQHARDGKIVCRVQTLDDPSTKVVSGPYMLRYKPMPAPREPAALPIKVVTDRTPIPERR